MASTKQHEAHGKSFFLQMTSHRNSAVVIGRLLVQLLELASSPLSLLFSNVYRKLVVGFTMVFWLT